MRAGANVPTEPEKTAMRTLQRQPLLFTETRI